MQDCCLDDERFTARPATVAVRSGFRKVTPLELSTSRSSKSAIPV